MYNPNYFNFSRPTKIIEVNGVNGANSYSLAPNSSVLLLDTANPVVYMKTTDGNGYATVSAYDLIPHKEETTSDLEERIKRLEAVIYESSIAKSNAAKSADTAAAND